MMQLRFELYSDNVIAQLGKRKDFGSNVSNWLLVRSNYAPLFFFENVHLFACVFTSETPKSE